LPIILTARIAADAGRSIDRHWCPDSEVRIMVPQSYANFGIEGRQQLI